MWMKVKGYTFVFSAPLPNLSKQAARRAMILILTTVSAAPRSSPDARAVARAKAVTRVVAGGVAGMVCGAQ